MRNIINRTLVIQHPLKVIHLAYNFSHVQQNYYTVQVQKISLQVSRLTEQILTECFVHTIQASDKSWIYPNSTNEMS